MTLFDCTLYRGGTQPLLPKMYLLIFICSIIELALISFYVLKYIYKSNFERKTYMFKKLLKICASIIAFILIIYILLMINLSFALRPNVNTFEFRSLDNKYTLVVKEESALFSGKGTFFKKEESGELVKIGSYSTNDGFEPFTNNTHHLTWSDSVVRIEYDFGSEGLRKQITLDLSFDGVSNFYDSFVKDVIE